MNVGSTEHLAQYYQQQGFKSTQKITCPPLSLPPSSSIARVGSVWLGAERHACRDTGRPAPRTRPTRLSGRAGGGARTREPPPGRRGGPHGPSRLLPFIREALTAAASAVSTRGLGSAAAWDAQSGAECVCLWGGVGWGGERGAVAGAAWASPWGAPGWVPRWGWVRGEPARPGAVGAVWPLPQRWGRTGGLRRLRCPARSLCCRLGWGSSQASCCQVGRDSGVASRIWGRPPAPLLPRAHLRGKAPSSSESFFPGFLLGNRSGDPSLGPAVARELSVTWILKYFRDTCPESGSQSIPRLSVGVSRSVFR